MGAENSEKQINSQLARQIEASLPRELDMKQCVRLVEGFVKERFVEHGMVADVVFHGMGTHNPHLHILLTTRKLEGEGFSRKKCDAWRPPLCRLPNGHIIVDTAFLKAERKAWETHCNAMLEAQGYKERIDCRTLAEQRAEALERGDLDKAEALQRAAGFHIGRNAWHAERRGQVTEAGRKLRNIHKLNDLRAALYAWRDEMQAVRGYTLPFLHKARRELERFLCRDGDDALPLCEQAPDIPPVGASAPPVTADRRVASLLQQMVGGAGAVGARMAEAAFRRVSLYDASAVIPQLGAAPLMIESDDAERNTIGEDTGYERE